MVEDKENESPESKEESDKLKMEIVDEVAIELLVEEYVGVSGVDDEESILIWLEMIGSLYEA